MKHNASTMILYMESDSKSTTDVLNWINTKETALLNFNVSSATLDDVFVHSQLKEKNNETVTQMVNI